MMADVGDTGVSKGCPWRAQSPWREILIKMQSWLRLSQAPPIPSLYSPKIARDRPVPGMGVGMELECQARSHSLSHILFHGDVLHSVYNDLKNILHYNETCKSHYYLSSYSGSPGSQRKCLLFEWKNREVSSMTAKMRSNYRSPVLMKWKHSTTALFLFHTERLSLKTDVNIGNAALMNLNSSQWG